VQHWGKLIGAMAGLATGRIWLGLIGVVLGHQFDRGFAERFRAKQIDEEPPTQLPEYFLRALFQTMGHLAKADGRVSEAEIRAARALMHRLDLSPGRVRQAISWFEAGKDKAFPLVATARQLRSDTARQPRLRSVYVRLLTEVSLAKSRLSGKERALLWSVCQELDIGRVELAQLEAVLRAQRAFAQKPTDETDDARMTRAYLVLGVDRSSSNEEIKRAYRRLMNKHHPDKIAAENPDAGEIAAAEQLTRDIRNAYETLKTRRLIR